MRDVAKAAGVDTSTVSLALRNSARLPAATRSRVQAKARELGYRIHPQLAALMAARRAGKPLDRGAPLAFVTSYPTEEGWREFRHYRRLFDGAKSRAGQLGYAVDCLWAADPGISPARFSGILYPGLSDG